MAVLSFLCSAVIIEEMSGLLARITIDPEICHGKPAIRHLRYPVESMLEYLVAGDTFEDLLGEFPDLERDDLRACLEFSGAVKMIKAGIWRSHEIRGGRPSATQLVRLVRGHGARRDSYQPVAGAKSDPR
jgi:uncharacterized protein (DUF433 family)